MPASIKEEISRAAHIYKTSLTEGDKSDPIAHKMEYDGNHTLKRITIFVNSAQASESEKSQNDVANSFHANLDLIRESMIEAAIGYLATLLPPTKNASDYAQTLREAFSTISNDAHLNILGGTISPKKVFDEYQFKLKEIIKNHARKELHLSAWDTDRFYAHAGDHRLQAEVVVVTHNNGVITHFGYQSATATNAHTKGIAASPPNSTSFFEYQVRPDGSTVLLDAGHSLASPAPKKSADATGVIVENLLVATTTFLETRRALETAAPSSKEDSKSEILSEREKKEDPVTVVVHLQTPAPKPPLHVFHILLTTPQATGANDGQWDSWKKEMEAIESTRENPPTITINGEERPVHLHMVASGINERWSTYDAIYKANAPAIRELIDLLNQQQGEKKVAADSLIAAINTFADPKSPYFYMKDGGNALRFNQVLSKACRLTDSVYLVGCKSGNDRTYLQTLFNAAANGSPNPGLLHLTNTVLDTAATPKALLKKFGTAYNSGFFPVAKPTKGGNKEPLPGEIDNTDMLQKAADNYPRYQQIGTAFHKAQRNAVQAVGKGIAKFLAK